MIQYLNDEEVGEPKYSDTKQVKKEYHSMAEMYENFYSEMNVDIR